LWTYGQLFDAADNCRRWLEAEVPSGPLLFLPRNTLSSLAFLLGSIGSGKVPLFGDTAWQVSEIEGVIQRCGVRAAAWDGPLPERLPGLSAVSERGGLALLRVNAPALHSAALRADTAFGRFTSGSTGFPRCLQFRDSATLAATGSWCQATEISSADRVLCLATLNNGLAFNTSIFTVLFAGGTLTFHEGLMVRTAVGRTLARTDPTILVAFPFAYELLTRSETFSASPSLRLAVSSAARLPENVKESWLRQTSLRICDYYGLAEVGPCTFNDGTVSDSVGVPLPGVRVSITGDDGGELRPGETGQIRVSTRSMASAYLDDCTPDFASNLDERNYYVTKDRGLVSTNGRLALQGRIGRLVNVAGRKIDPSEVEALLRRMPGIREVVVRGEGGAERTFLAAYIESGSVTREDVVDFCLNQMAQYKVPQRIAIMPQLPRSSAGKVSVAGISAGMEGVCSEN
jgi:long-chain acyl-CoA synthetase